MNRRFFYVFVVAAIILALVLHAAGQPWWCACHSYTLWSGDIWSEHNSQHLFDPYSFSHIQHGLIFYGLFWMIGYRYPLIRSYSFLGMLLIESGWEVLENSPLMIERYRAATISLGYVGDSVANSIGDLFSCAVGFMIARRISVKSSIALCIGIEIVMIVFLRDSLLLNMIMLIHPSDTIKRWQTPVSSP